MAEAEELAVEGEAMSEDAERPTTPDIYCDPCLADDERQYAEGFCVDCNEYLCLYCFKAHRKSKTSKFHQLKSKAEMPPTKPATETEEEKCIHHNRELKFYCKSHNKVLCELCKDVDHRTCKNVNKIECLDKTYSYENKDQWLNDLDYIENQFNANKMILERHKDSVEFYYKQATRNIRRIADGNKEMLRAIESTCDSVKPGIAALRRDISRHDSGRSLFLLQYRVNNQTNELQQRLKSVTTDNKITRYWCRPSDSAGKAGFVVEHQFEDNELEVNTDTDKVKCTITAIGALSTTKLIIADQANRKLKVFDTIGKAISSEIKVDKEPWDLSVIDENTVAMTTGDDNEIQVLSFSEQMSEPRKIKRNDFQSCKGIAFSKGSLVASHSTPNEIQVLDLEGKPKHTINLHDRNGPIMTGTIEYLAKSHVAPHLYMLDTLSNEILCVSLDGFVNARFKHSHLSGATGITAGRDGRVFVVCSYKTYKKHHSFGFQMCIDNTVLFELNSDLSSGEIILEQEDGVMKQPRGIFYDDEEHKLFVGCKGKNEVLVFLV